MVVLTRDFNGHLNILALSAGTSFRNFQLNTVLPIPGFHEPFSCISHLLGAVVFCILAVGLIYRGLGSRSRIAYLSVYSFSCVLLLSMSTLFHMLGPGKAHNVFSTLDLAAIFVLIAGSFTALHGLLFKGRGRHWPIVLIWSLAIMGILWRIFFEHYSPSWLGVTMYLAMGWIGVFWAVVLWRRYGFSFVKLLFAGGMAYSVGALLNHFSILTLIPGVLGPHEVFHIMVLLGMGLHWSFIYSIASGESPPLPRQQTALIESPVPAEFY